MKTSFIRSLILLITVISFTGYTFQDEGNDKDIKTVLLPVEGDPTITIRIWFNVGSQNDPVGKEGLTNLTASLLSGGGTINNSYEEILEKLYPLAAGYSASVSKEMTIFSGRVHKDNLKKYYPMFIEALLNPAFNEEDFNRTKSQVLNYLNRTIKYANDEELGKAVLYTNIFKGTQYGHLDAGTISGVESITLYDITSFYQKYFNRNNLIIGIGGGFDDEFIEQLKKDLKQLPDGSYQKVQKPQYQGFKGLHLTLINKTANATAISMGFPIDILRGSREWYALAIANSWFGEHRNSSSHLFQVIREVRGLNYGDYSYIEHFPNGGSLTMPPVNVSRRQQLFEIWIRPVPNETRHFVLRAALRELQLLVNNGLTEDQFELTKNFLKKYVLHYAPTTNLRLGYAMDDVFYGMNKSHLELFRKMMDEITLDEVNTAIKKHLQFDNIKIAVITENAEDFKQALIENRESLIKYATPKAEEVYEVDKNIVNYKLNIPEENIKILGVQELFQ